MTAEKHHFSIEREQRFGLLYAYNGIAKPLKMLSH